MGLSNSSVGINAVDRHKDVVRHTDSELLIALAGNPNVGKSTLFNNLTGMKQHTGNWPGKTVTNAFGTRHHKEKSFVFADLPGTYSLMAHSAEEEVARNFICFENPDAVVVVCDAASLERNLNLVLQTLEITNNAVVCVNLLDEAKKKGINVNLETLSQCLGIPVVGTVARKKKSAEMLLNALSDINKKETKKLPLQVFYGEDIEKAVKMVSESIPKEVNEKLNERWLSLKLLEDDIGLCAEINKYLGFEFTSCPEIKRKVDAAWSELYEKGYSKESFKDKIVASIMDRSSEICKEVFETNGNSYSSFDRKADRILTSRMFGFPIMLGMLAVVFWITIVGANYPSQWLSRVLFYIQDRLLDILTYLKIPETLTNMLVLGVYRVLAWVVSVMLPPMAIFFPLFTLLEDSGYLPRIAYNLDKPFRKCCACGKQAMTMCMGFGCNAAGIVGCRIIDSPRERLLAILTNNFVPCNGRFPTLIAIITMFFAGTYTSVKSGILSSLLLTFVIVLGIGATFAATKLLSMTLLKGMSSAFTIELPSYRRPQVGKVIVRSIFDRTLFVLARSASVAAPAGLVIWLMANIKVFDVSLLRYCADFLDPIGHILGLDGVILIAFILGFPANEIVMPIIVMAYLSTGTITEMSSLEEMHALFVLNGWTPITAICMMIFTLMHWPCSTSCLTVWKETKSAKWTALSMLVPTVFGAALCMLVKLASEIVFKLFV